MQWSDPTTAEHKQWRDSTNKERDTSKMNEERWLQQRFASSPRQIGLKSRGKRIRTRAAGRSRGHRPTCDKGNNHNADTEQQVAVCLVSCVKAVTGLPWRPREHT